MIDVLCAATVLIGVVAFSSSAVLRVAWHWAAPWLAQVEPRARVRWLLGLLTAPLALGGVVLALAAAPCFAELVLSGRDCTSHGELVCLFCLLHPAQTSIFTQLAAVLLVLPLVVRGVQVSVAASRLRRALRSLRTVARHDRARDVWSMPGSAAFSAGWSHGEVFVGEALEHSLDPSALDAVTAHEHAHVRRRDLVLKGLARILAGVHLPGAAQPFVEALDLALEQACDIEASEAVHDPLIVAQALLDVTRLQHTHASETLAPCGSGVLEARVEALCNPSWVPSRAALLAVGLASLATLAVGCVATQQVHHAADVMFAALTR